MMIFETISFVNFDFIQERWEMVFGNDPATIDDEENKRDITVTTISAYVDIHFLSVPGLTRYSQRKSSSLYRHPDRVPIHILHVDIPIAQQQICP